MSNYSNNRNSLNNLENLFRNDAETNKKLDNTINKMNNVMNRNNKKSYNTGRLEDEVKKNLNEIKNREINRDQRNRNRFQKKNQEIRNQIRNMKNNSKIHPKEINNYIYGLTGKLINLRKSRNKSSNQMLDELDKILDEMKQFQNKHRHSNSKQNNRTNNRTNNRNKGANLNVSNLFGNLNNIEVSNNNNNKSPFLRDAPKDKNGNVISPLTNLASKGKQMAYLEKNKDKLLKEVNEIKTNKKISAKKLQSVIFKLYDFIVTVNSAFKLTADERVSVINDLVDELNRDSQFMKELNLALTAEIQNNKQLTPVSTNNRKNMNNNGNDTLKDRIIAFQKPDRGNTNKKLQNFEKCPQNNNKKNNGNSFFGFTQSNNQTKNNSMNNRNKPRNYNKNNRNQSTNQTRNQSRNTRNQSRNNRNQPRNNRNNRNENKPLMSQIGNMFS